MSLFNVTNPALRTGSAGQETATQVVADVPDEEFDLVIMNPPFTRATNHEGAHADVTNPAFAAFGATKADQTAMGRRINQSGRETCYHGNAGVSSAFAALANRKLRPGGILAMVLPLSVTAGLSWSGFRELIGQEYTDLTVLSIAANGRDMSFSSDTGMAECLVIVRKGVGEKDFSLLHRGRFTSLRSRPQNFAHAHAIANNIVESGSIRTIENGPYGGSALVVGDTSAGEELSVPDSMDGEVWGAVRISDYSVAQAAYALENSKLWLPGERKALDVAIRSLGSAGKLGLVHRDITGPPPRGPFDLRPSSPTATYPSLWNHDARKEARIVCEPDSQLQARPGMEEKAAEVWATASRTHINLDFTFGSQPLSVAFTERESVGGRVWPNVIFNDKRMDFAFSVWANSTLGLLCHWWHSSRQQSSKAGMTIRSAESLPVLDFRTLTDEQLSTAESIFDEFRDIDLMPAYLADIDPKRAQLDRSIVRDLLGFDRVTYEAVRLLAAKWCAEPSVHGGKRRPKGSGVI